MYIVRMFSLGLADTFRTLDIAHRICRLFPKAGYTIYLFLVHAPSLITICLPLLFATFLLQNFRFAPILPLKKAFGIFSP